jgi:PAS domain S-box-containing protein
MPLSPESVHPPALGWRLLAIGLAIAAILVPAAGLFVYTPRAESRARDELVEMLNTRAENRASGISRWADDALRDARLIASYPSAIALLREGTALPGTESHLIDALQPFVAIKGYGQVLIVRDGQVLAQAANRSTSPGCVIFPTPSQTTAVGLHTHEDGSTWVTFAARIDVPLPGNPAVLLEQPATNHLFGLLARSPLPFQTTESTLIAREGEGFRYLSPLRNGADRRTATIPADSAMARLLRGGAGAQRGTAADYRGAPTFVAARPIAGTPWLVTLKVDENDALAGPRRMIRVTIIAWSAVALSAALAASAVLSWQRRRRDAAAVRELTARREVESALRRSESLFRTVFQRSPIGILMATLDGHITRANPAVEQMLGYAAAELETMTLRDLTAPEDLSQREVPSESADLSYPNGYRLEKRYRHKDGVIIWGEVTVTFVRDERDDASFALVLVQDISERRALQDQLFQAQKMESIGRLAGGVAHDFNNLLTAILGYAEVLEEEVRGNPQARGFVEEIQHAGSRAATLTAQLLAFARRQVVTRRVLDLNDVVDDAARMLHRVLGRNIHTELRFAPDLWNVDADPNQLQQIIVNMAVNARDAMPHGGRLIIETANDTLEETRARVDALFGDYVRLSISDTGEGMTPDVVAHIFEPFFTTKEQGKGTGLGLAMCHGIATQNGGQIRVMTEPGRGTTFNVYLPRARRAQQTPDARLDAPAVRDRGHLVLLAEDETPVRTLAAQVLTRRGFRVLEAQDGGEALRLARAHADEIDLLLTDVTMPVLGGRELAEQFRHVCPGAKILFMSGHPESVIAHNGVLDPGVAYVAKPFTPDQISTRVRDLLAGV